MPRLNPGFPHLKPARSARCKPYAAKTNGFYPFNDRSASVHRVISANDSSGAPRAKQDLETIRFCVFAAPGLHRA
jgi:hypothetical protein